MAALPFDAAVTAFVAHLEAERRASEHTVAAYRRDLGALGLFAGADRALDSFDVTLAPGEPPRMLTLEGDAERAARWYFEHFRPADNYIGALAIEGDPPGGGAWRVETWAFNP